LEAEIFSQGSWICLYFDICQISINCKKNFEKNIQYNCSYIGAILLAIILPSSDNGLLSFKNSIFPFSRQLPISFLLSSRCAWRTIQKIRRTFFGKSEGQNLFIYLFIY